MQVVEHNLGRGIVYAGWLDVVKQTSKPRINSLAIACFVSFCMEYERTALSKNALVVRT